MTTKWADKTRALILTGELPEGNIKTMRQILARALNHADNAWMTGTPSCNGDQAQDIMELVEQRKPRVSDEQARKGAAWLYKSVFTSRGEVRSTEYAQQFRAGDLDVIRFMHLCMDRNLVAQPRFNLIGFYDTREHGARYCTLFPIYRAWGESARYFDYVARAWQAGGNSFILSHA